VSTSDSHGGAASTTFTSERRAVEDEARLADFDGETAKGEVVGKLPSYSRVGERVGHVGSMQRRGSEDSRGAGRTSGRWERLTSGLC
jgi:hypothetical protein